ncbi:hypothetical protein, partial [Mariniluteicoccus endophyticus]
MSGAEIEVRAWIYWFMRATSKLSNYFILFKTRGIDAVLDMTDIAYLNYGESPSGPRQMAKETTQRVFDHLAFHRSDSYVRLVQLGDRGWVGIEPDAVRPTPIRPLLSSSERVILNAAAITGDPRHSQLEQRTFVCFAWQAGAFWRDDLLVFPEPAAIDDQLEETGPTQTSSPPSLARRLLSHIDTIPDTPE